MEHIQKALFKYWDYDGFLPVQKQAMECVSRGQEQNPDVLPKGRLTVKTGWSLFKHEHPASSIQL